jgi:hypothetical protein
VVGCIIPSIDFSVNIERTSRHKLRNGQKLLFRKDASPAPRSEKGSPPSRPLCQPKQLAFRSA